MLAYVHIACIFVSAVQTTASGLQDVWQAQPCLLQSKPHEQCILQLTCNVLKSELQDSPNAIKVDLARHPVFGALHAIDRQRNDPERGGYPALLAATIGI